MTFSYTLLCFSLLWKEKQLILRNVKFRFAIWELDIVGKWHCGCYNFGCFSFRIRRVENQSYKVKNMSSQISFTDKEKQSNNKKMISPKLHNKKAKRECCFSFALLFFNYRVKINKLSLFQTTTKAMLLFFLRKYRKVKQTISEMAKWDGEITWRNQMAMDLALATLNIMFCMLHTKERKTNKNKKTYQYFCDAFWVLEPVHWCTPD